jgi:hypothetical protein
MSSHIIRSCILGIPVTASVVVAIMMRRRINYICEKTHSRLQEYTDKYYDEQCKFTDEEWMKIVKADGLMLKFAPNKHKTFELCLAAVTQNGLALQYVPNKHKTFELCSAAYNNTPMAKFYIQQTYVDIIDKNNNTNT